MWLAIRRLAGKMISPSLPPSDPTSSTTDDAAHLIEDALAEEGSGFVPPTGLKCFSCGSTDVILAEVYDEGEEKMVWRVECNACMTKAKVAL
jgi:hypothetical protein